MFPALERFIEQQKWLDSVGDPLQKYIGSLFESGGPSGKQVKNILNGTWLGHPLHPMITDVPVGAWTVTLVLDTIASTSRNESFETAADISLATGWVAAAGAAASGFTDWSDTYGRERNVGLLHGLTMVTGFVAYTVALLARLSGARSFGVALSNLGYGVVAAGAYLGGDEVYDLGYGVNHTAFQSGPGEYVPVMAESDLQPNRLTKADAQGAPVVLARLGSAVYALDDTCVHAGCSLAGGTLEGTTIICPCHGSQFDLRSGQVINGPATMPEPHYDVRVQNGVIEVKQAQV